MEDNVRRKVFIYKNTTAKKKILAKDIERWVEKKETFNEDVILIHSDLESDVKIWKVSMFTAV